MILSVEWLAASRQYAMHMYSTFILRLLPLVFLSIPSFTFGQTQLGQDIRGEDPEGFFGWQIALSADGQRFAAGAPMNSISKPELGQARVYRFSAGNWTQVGEDIEGLIAYDQAGASVDLSADGRRIAVGSYFGEVYTPIDTFFPGHVRIFDEIGGNWEQVGANIDGEGEAEFDRFGQSVALTPDGRRVVSSQTDLV